MKAITWQDYYQQGDWAMTAWVNGKQLHVPFKGLQLVIDNEIILYSHKLWTIVYENPEIPAEECIKWCKQRNLEQKEVEYSYTTLTPMVTITQARRDIMSFAKEGKLKHIATTCFSKHYVDNFINDLCKERFKNEINKQL